MYTTNVFTLHTPPAFLCSVYNILKPRDTTVDPAAMDPRGMKHLFRDEKVQSVFNALFSNHQRRFDSCSQATPRGPHTLLNYADDAIKENRPRESGSMASDLWSHQLQPKANAVLCLLVRSVCMCSINN
jgi:hypothetical protein